MPLTFSLLSFSIAAGILIALYVVRQHRRAIEREQAERDAFEFRDEQLRRVK